LILRLAVAATALYMSAREPVCAQDAAAAMRKPISIPAQPLGAALEALAKERDLQVIYHSEVVGERRTSGIVGDLTLGEALSRLLSGSGLTYRYLNYNTVTIVPAAPPIGKATVDQEQTVKRSRWPWLSSALAALFTGWGGHSLAQSSAAVSAPPATEGLEQSSATTSRSSGVQLEEIVVTATKRAESQEKVPLSITAYTQDTLDKQQAKDFNDIVRLTPGVTLTPQTRGNTAGSDVSIRGISSGAGAATVGIYIDEAPVQIRPDSLSSVNPYPRIFDLERVEILRGPQGTLFGAGSEGGTIRFITPDPSLDHYSSYVRSDLSTTRGGDPSYEFGAAGGGPIADDELGFRVSAWYRRDGGYIDRISWTDQQLLERNSNWDDAKVLRGALRWRPLDNLNLIGSVYYQETTVNDSSIYWETFSDPGANQFRNANQFPTPTHDRFTLPALKATWDLGRITLVSNSSYLDRRNENIYDNSSLSLAVFTGYAPVNLPQQLANYRAPGFLLDTQNVFTQEVRLQSNEPMAGLTWVVGVYYQHSHQDAANNIQNPYLDEALTFVSNTPMHVPLYQDLWFLYSTSALTDEEKSVFGQGDYHVTDKLTLTAGVRVAHHKYDNTQFGAGPVVGTNVGITSVSSQADTPVTPKFVISYQANSDTLLYSSAAKGYRQGSTAGQAPINCKPDLDALGLTTDARIIQPDYVWSYEVGAKNRVLGGRLQLDSSIYQINWKNIQSGLTLPLCNVPITANFGDARSRGVDTQANLLATDHLSLMLSISYADAKFTTTTYGADDKVIRSAGQPLSIVPWKVSTSAQYDFAMFQHGAYIRFDDQYSSHDNTPLDLASAATDPTIPRTPSYNLLSGRLGMRFGGWDVSMYGTNLMNQHPELSRYRDTTNTFLYRGLTLTPLTVGFNGIFRY
jgi:iron complex outermembrane recepter protein